MPNSKTLSQAILAAFCAILCALSSLGGGGMNRRRILAAVGSHMPTAKDYVQTNLIAMFDGIENVGLGLPHNSDATIWADLTDNGFDVTISSGYGSFTADGLRIDAEVYSNGSVAKASKPLPYNDNNNYFEFVIENKSSLSGSAWTVVTGGTVESGSNNAQNFVIAYYWSAYSRGGFVTGTPSDFLRQEPSFVLTPQIQQVALDPHFAAKNGEVATFKTWEGSPGVSSSMRQEVLSIFPRGEISEPRHFKVGTELKALRIYSQRLEDGDRLRNYAIDKARFNLT